MPFRRRRSLPSLGVIGVSALAAVLWVGAAATGVAAHVNRTVGPYTILVVLVEEPVYADNHAGFEFWVRKDEVPILGLEQSIKAVASGHGEQVDLAVPPIDGTGFYVLDHTTDGAAFDPHGGGAWTLVLSGAIDGTPVDATFPVTFPNYPRVGAATTPAAAPAGGSTEPASGGVPAWVVALVAAGLVGGIATLAMASRRRQRGAKRPVLTT
jgi:hypothetical protein